MKRIQLGFNTTGNNQTNGRNSTAVALGKLRNTIGSTSRKLKYCNRNQNNLDVTFRCVFDIPESIMNIDGRYQIAVGQGVLSISKDYGLTWENKQQFSTYDLIGVAISNDGKYILTGGYNFSTTSGTPLFYSNDGGSTFSEVVSSNSWYDIKMSKSGKYQTAIGPSNTVYISNNYGSSFSTKTITGLIVGSNYLGMSNDGKYQSITSQKVIYISNDYGENWNSVDLSGITNPPGDLYGISMSGNGKIQMAVEYSGNKIYKSVDYGNTWTNIFTLPASSNLYFISISESGQYQVIPSYGGNVWISNDYGNTFTNNLNINGLSQSLFGVRGWYPSSVSSSGQYQTICDFDGVSPFVGGYIYTSSDYGQNWFVRTTSGIANWWGLCMN